MTSPSDVGDALAIALEALEDYTPDDPTIAARIKSVVREIELLQMELDELVN